MARTMVFLSVLILLNCRKAASQLNFKPKNDTMVKSLTIRVLPQNFYSKQLGFVCRKEIQIQKLTRLPLFIRLGSKDQTDFLEGKSNVLKKIIR